MPTTAPQLLNTPAAAACISLTPSFPAAQTVTYPKTYNDFYTAVTLNSDASTCKKLIDALGLKATMSNPKLALTVLVPSDTVSCAQDSNTTPACSYHHAMPLLAGPSLTFHSKQDVKAASARTPRLSGVCKHHLSLAMPNVQTRLRLDLLFRGLSLCNSPTMHLDKHPLVPCFPSREHPPLPASTDPAFPCCIPPGLQHHGQEPRDLHHLDEHLQLYLGRYEVHRVLPLCDRQQRREAGVPHHPAQGGHQTRHHVSYLPAWFDQLNATLSASLHSTFDHPICCNLCTTAWGAQGVHVAYACTGDEGRMSVPLMMGRLHACVAPSKVPSGCFKGSGHGGNCIKGMQGTHHMV